MNVNMTIRSAERKISRLLRTLGQPARIQILLAIGSGEACVCHLEAVLGERQAFISQHLMALRKAHVLASRREGRYVYYRLRDPQLLEMLQLAGEQVGLPRLIQLDEPIKNEEPACGCPHCAADLQEE
jgi:ArsR family transcriptional regulator